MSDCDGLRRRKNIVAKQPSAEASDDVMTPDDDVKRSRDNCVDVIRGMWWSIISRLYQPVDASSLAVFRMLFGEYIVYSLYGMAILNFDLFQTSRVTLLCRRVTTKSADVGPYVFEK